MDLAHVEIAKSLEQGKVIPFLGTLAGMSRRAAGSGVGESNRPLPSRRELALELAMDASFPATEDPGDLAKVASYFVETRGRAELLDRLHEIFAREYEPNDIHELLATIKRPMLIVTTNVDDLLERALTRAGKRFDVVVSAVDRRDLEGSVLHRRSGANEFVGVSPLRLAIDLDATTVVYKMHGSVGAAKGAGNYVITEEDHLRFLSRMATSSAIPVPFARRMCERRLLFVGQQLRSWHERLLMRHLRPFTESDPRGELGSSWAICESPSVLECELWGASRVKVFDQEVSEFVSAVRAELFPTTA